ncbi:4-hydroxyphenylpyruvate dioxygenase [Aerosakkonemataceae cyanobacterium BLCC-F154]|uniref:4-hydroxyphenylpyruvate dioxygenase n=1 Tax=Floridaenema fluviatile BLCC-F154 TaxID=3153640 RepID=A0ABV4YI79_9CYAN
MKIDHIHFYVEDATLWRNWFISQMGFQAVSTGVWQNHTLIEVVKNGTVCFFLSSPLLPESPVAEFLRSHPPGVADVAFRVQNIEKLITQALNYGAKLLQPIVQKPQLKWAKISAWGNLTHTLIEGQGNWELGIENWQNKNHSFSNSATPVTFTGIDHVVLNVAAGELEPAVNWYEKVLELQRQQTFAIQTDWSALNSQVLVHPNKLVQFPINQPASPNSQIQEFLDFNQGPGIQHIALQTSNLVETTKFLRNAKLKFLEVAPTYYTDLQKRQNIPLNLEELQAIQAQQILVDWQQNLNNNQSEIAPLLLQIFTQPIFGQPTFFFELIERRLGYIQGEKIPPQGFGEGNFRALFQAIEREQIKRSQS